MNLAFFISKRYLLAKKSHNAINIITTISVVLVAIGTMALISIMSVFNGLENVVASLNSSASSDLVIEPVNSKYIDLTVFPDKKLSNQRGIKYRVDVLEDNVLLKYTPALEENSPREFIGRIKGVGKNYNKASSIEQMMIDGTFLLKANGEEYCVVGNGVASRLQIHLNDFDNPIRCYFPKAEANLSLNPLDAISIENIQPSGVFSVQQEVDDKLMIASLDFTQKLMNLDNKLSSILLSVNENVDIDKIQDEVSAYLGSDYSLKNRMQQNEVMYNIMKSEKWSSFLILAFILFIATFNLVGALSVLIIDKQSDIQTLSFIGATKSVITKIFLFEGFMVTLSGTILGLLLGIVLVWLQDTFGVIPLNGAFAVDYFPVELRFSDIAVVLGVVVLVSMLVVVYPIRRFSKTLSA